MPDFDFFITSYCISNERMSERAFEHLPSFSFDALWIVVDNGCYFFLVDHCQLDGYKQILFHSLYIGQNAKLLLLINYFFH